MNTDYIPSRFNDLVVWTQNLYSNLLPIKGQLGVSDAEMMYLKQYGDDLADAAQLRQRAEDLWHNTVAYCDLLTDGPEGNVAYPVLDFNATAASRRGGFKPFVRRLARKIKAAPYYNEDIGKLLGLTSSTPGHDFTNAQPDLHGTVNHLYNLLRYKKGAADGANIYCRASGVADYTLLGYTPHPEYQHNLLPARHTVQYDYYAVYVYKGREVGTASKTLTLLVQGVEAPEQP
ncbi:MAG: hypothetical protein LBK71_02470 [Verrucomicrobiales bacterium]|jgi:hypothetical protein|nr:hypothetical protein [Verrucomicrobiales bacterium]